jgi:hypothetical protein
MRTITLAALVAFFALVFTATPAHAQVPYYPSGYFYNYNFGMPYVQYGVRSPTGFGHGVLYSPSGYGMYYRGYTSPFTGVYNHQYFPFANAGYLRSPYYVPYPY